MPFIDDILKYRSLSIVGLAKNTGKTEALGYILRRLSSYPKTLAVTSIGIDGEGVDIVTSTPKPLIRLNCGNYFVTTGQFYAQKRFTSEILDVGSETVLGPYVLARALEPGNMVMCGPSDTVSMVGTISELKNRYGVDLTIVDGALSRLSLASPAVTEAMVLTTGAAYGGTVRELTEKTKFVCDLVALPLADEVSREMLREKENGIWSYRDGEWSRMEVTTALSGESLKSAFANGLPKRLYVSGAVSEALLKFLMEQEGLSNLQFIVKDFSRFFVQPMTYYSFAKKVGALSVLYRTTLVAVCINPYSPVGRHLDSCTLQKSMEDVLGIRVYDVRKCAYDA